MNGDCSAIQPEVGNKKQDKTTPPNPHQDAATRKMKSITKHLTFIASRKPISLFIVTQMACIFSLLAAAHGQTIYNNNGTIPGDWIDADNWSTGVPISTSAVEIGVQPTGGILNMAGAGDGSGTVTMASLDFSASLGGDVDFMGTGTEMLEVNGAISNSSAFNVTFSIPVLSVASAVWSGPMLFQDLVMVDTTTITLTGTAIFSATLDFNIVDTVTFGRLSDSGSAMFFGSTITVGGTYTGNLGDTFDLTNQSFTGASLGWLPTLDPGLEWDSTNFLADGTLTVVPEPTTGFLISVGLAALLAYPASQRRKNRTLKDRHRSEGKIASQRHSGRRRHD